MTGLRLSQVSQAGKSHVLRRYAEWLDERTMLATGTISPHQVLYVCLSVRITLKMLCVQLLRMLGCPHADKGNVDEVKQRTREFVEARGVELLIIDEVQHLKTDTIASVDVTDELKNFLELGIVPVVFAGNEESRPFFEANTQLASRLGTPLELSAVDTAQNKQLADFATFCVDLDEALVTAACTRRQSGFGDPLILDALLRASGGMLGRVCRIVESALEYASLRDADFVEAFDLSWAIDNFAIPQRYTSSNPFPIALREAERRDALIATMATAGAQ
jgi:AAA domain